MRAALINAVLMVALLVVVHQCQAGPFLELGIGDFVGPYEWPDSPDCECGTYLGNEGALGMIRAGYETPVYNLFWKVEARIQASVIHISNTGTGRDTGINAAFVGVRLE